MTLAKILIKTIPDPVFCATDSCLPRWRLIAGGINHTKRIWMLDKIQIRVKGKERVHRRSFSGETLERLIVPPGGYCLKPEQVVAAEICDDGKIKKPQSVNVTMLFSARNGTTTSVVKKVELPRYKTLWLDFPLVGRWTVANGRTDNHCLGAQFGFDFVTPEDMEIHLKPDRGRFRLDDFSSLGRPIYSPSDGIVVSCSNRERDYRRPFKQTIGDKPVNLRTFVGNHVLIETADRQFIMLAHMLNQSIRVRVGDSVSAGNYLGKVGNSGNTTGPHLHIEVLRVKPDFSQKWGSAVLPSGLPFGFRNIARLQNESAVVMSRCVPKKLDQLESDRKQPTRGLP